MTNDGDILYLPLDKLLVRIARRYGKNPDELKQHLANEIRLKKK